MVQEGKLKLAQRRGGGHWRLISECKPFGCDPKVLPWKMIVSFLIIFFIAKATPSVPCTKCSVIKDVI